MTQIARLFYAAKRVFVTVYTVTLFDIRYDLTVKVIDIIRESYDRNNSYYSKKYQQGGYKRSKENNHTMPPIKAKSDRLNI